MDFNTDLGQATKLGARLSVLAMAVALAACGGGGASDAVKAPTNNNGGGTNQPAASQYALTLSTDKPSLKISGDTVTITATALEKIGGGRVAGQMVQLVLPNAIKNGLSIAGPSKVETNDAGQAVFVLQLTPNSNAEQQALLTKGLDLEVVLVEANGAEVRQRTVLNVVQPGTQISAFNLDIFTDKQVANVNGDTIAVTLRVSDSNTGGVTGQRVILGIPNGLRGVLIDGASESVTDGAGNAIFSVKIAEKLTAAEIAELLKGISLVARLVDSTGAEKLQNRLLTAARPTAQYNLAIQSSAPNLNVFGDEVTLSVQASAIAGASVAGQSITVALATGTPAGVQLDGNTTALTNEQGVAQFKLKLVAGLSQQAIDALLAQPLGLGIGATLTERSGAQASTALVIPVVKPSIQNTIRLDVTKNALVATGDTMQVIATVLDKNNGAVAGQRVTLKLEATNGVSIEGAATIQTDAKGLAVFNIRLNDKLSVAEREALVNIGIKATATLVEASGASIATPTRTIVVSQPGSNPLQSIYTAEIGLSKAVVSRNGDTVTVTVRAKDKNGGGVKDQQITLGLPNGIKGVVIDGSSTQMTDDKGLASFVLQISNQVDVSDIALNVTLVEQNGAIATTSKTLKVEAPVATLTPSITLSRNSISVDGGAVDVTVRAVNASGGSVAGQKITLSLPTNTTAAVIDGDSVLTTNAQGIAVFRVLVKAGVSPQSIGLGAVITEASGAISPAALASIVVENPAADYKLGLSVSGQLNVFGGQVEIVAKMSSQYGASIAGKSVTLGLPSLPAGLTIDRTTTTTNAAGEARFTLTAAPNLSNAAQDKLLAEGLALTALFNQSANVQIQAPVLQVSAVRPAAQYQLSLTSSKSRVDVFGDSFVVTAQASNVQGGEVEDQAVTLTLAPQVNGIAIQGASTVRTNAQGQAQFVVSIAGLSVADRQKLVAESLQLNARLVEVTGASVSASTAVVAQAVLPDFYPEISLGQDQVSTQGAAIDVFVRVRNDAGASFAGQSTLLQISGQDGKPINGLVVDGAATAVSNEQGVARYRVLVPKGVSPQSLIVAAVVFSANGSVSTPATTSIIVSQPQAEYQLALSADNDQVSVYGDQIRVRVQASNVLGSTGSLANQTVRLGIPTLSGVEIAGGATALTDTNGVALFTINVGQLSQTARAELLKTNLPISAVLVQSNGIQIAAPTTLVRAIEPESSLFAEMTLANNPISTDGGTVAVTVRARDVQGGGVANQRVSLSLPLAVRGVVIDGASTVVTDAQGNARFNVTVPAGTAPQSILVSAVVIEANGSSSQSSSSSIEIQSKQSLYTLALSTDKQRVNVFGDSFTVVATTTATSGASVAGQRIALDLPSMAGLTAQASNNSLTNQRGEVTFTIQLSALSETDRASLLTGNLSLKATLLQTNGVQIAAPLLALQTQAPAAELTPTISFSKPTLSANGDSVTVSVRAADAKGGAVAGQTIDLMIDDGFAVAQIDGASRVVTGANGVATFTVKVSKTDPRDISVRARLTQPNGANVLSAPAVIRAEAPVSQYQLSLSADKVRLNVLGDTVRVTAQATNTVGGGVAGQPVTLTVAPQLTGIAIQGASTVETDDRGQAVFEISLAKLSAADQQTLLASGLGLTAVLREANGAAAVAPIRTLPVEVLIPEYYPEISLSQNQLTPAGGVVDVFVRVRNDRGASFADQTTLLSITGSTGQAINGLVIEGSATQQSNAQGVASYRVRVPAGINPQSLILSAVVTQAGGLVSRADTATIVVTNPQAQYDLALTTDKPQINGFGDRLQVRVKATSQLGVSLSGQTVNLGLPSYAGLEIEGGRSRQTDVNGIALFTVNIANLSEADRTTLAQNGLQIAAVLIQSNGVTVPAPQQGVTVLLPASTLFPEFTLSNNPISGVEGGTVSVVVRARDIQGGGVANQQVSLSLPLAVRGVVIDGSSTVTTDAQGNARFNVIVPAGSAVNPALELQAVITEPNGSRSVSNSASIVIQSAQAQYSLALRSERNSLNVYGDQLELIADLSAIQRGSTLAGQSIQFNLTPQLSGLNLVNNGRATTDTQGIARIQLNVSGLSETDRNNLATSGSLGIDAVLIQSNGIQINAPRLSIQAQQPAAELTPTISFSKPTLNANGDSVTVSVRAADAKGGAVAGQTIDLIVDDGFAVAQIDGASRVVTGANGVATFTMKVSKTDPRNISVRARLTQPNGANVLSASAVIRAEAPVSQYQLSLSADKVRLNVLGDTVRVTAQATNTVGGGVAGQPVTLTVAPQLTGIAIQGASTVQTDDRGQAVFNISLAKLSAADQETLLASGLGLTAVLRETNGAVATAPIRTVPVEVLIPEYYPEISLSQNQLTPAGGVVDVFVRVRNSQSGAVANQTTVLTVLNAAGQPVKGLVIEEVDPALSGDDNDTQTAVTNNQGVSRYRVVVPNGIAPQSLSVKAVAVRQGALVERFDETTIVVASPQAVYTLSSTPSRAVVNGYSDTFEVRLQASSAAGRSLAGQLVSIGLPRIDGVSIQGATTAETDVNGSATFTINISGVSAAGRLQLANEGLPIAALLVQSDGVRVPAALQNVQVEFPQSALFAEITNTSSVIFSEDGGTAQIQVRARDINGGGVAGQTVQLNLPAALRGVVIDGASSAQTDAQGVARFSVVVPVNTPAGAVPVTANVIEPNGASSASSITSISVQSKQSLYTLALRSSKPTVNVFGDSVTVVAAATALSGAPLAGQRISLDLPNITGLTAQASNGGLTNQRGEVTFTVSLNGLNEADRNGLLSGNLALSATLLQSNGVRIPASSLTLQAEAPIAALTPQISFSKQTLSANGDEVTVSVRAANSSGGAVAGQTIDLSVEAGFAAASITGVSSAVTDASGIATFVLKVNPTTLTEIGLSAVLTQPNGASRQNTGVIAVVAPVSQYRLSIQSDKSRLNVLGDTLLVTTQATNVQGGQVEDQPVTLMILPEFTGISIQGASTVRTNAQGQAQFIVSIAGLSATDRAALVNNGLALTAKLSEANGATRTATQSVTAFEPTGISSLNLALRSSQPQINIFGDQIDVTVLASTAQGIASAGQAVTIGLPALAGLTLTGAPTVTTNATGQATFSLTLSSTLSAAERAALLANGLPIAATLAEANGATKTINQTIAAFEPTASYQLSLVSSASPLNARGGTATIRVQVLDQDLRAVANRPVKVWLSSANNSAGLLSLNGQPANLLVDIQTNAQGIAEYQIAIPTGLTATQRSNLLQGVTANAIVTEQSGARNVFTQLLSVAEPTSSLVLGLQANKASINAASSDSFDVIVSLRDAENRAVSGQQLSFALSDIALRLGVTVAANTVNTDANGSAKFTVTTPVGLDVAALNGLLSYAVSLSAANGAIVTQTGMMAVVQPTARYALRLNADKIVKTSGDTFKVFAQAVDDAGNAIANQRVQLLVNDPIRTGVTVTGGAEIVTDANGLAVFELTLTPGANVNQLFLSAGIGLTARLTEDTGVQSRQALIVPVDTLNTTGQYRLSWTQSKSAFSGFGDEIAVTYRVTDANGGILAGVPVALKIQDALISGATLTTSSRLVTDANGLITTTVRLTGRDLDAVIGSNVVVVVAEVQAASFNAQGAPTVTTLASQSISLSKGGGAAFTLQSSLSVMRAGESTVVTAKLVDADGVPVANAPVEFIDEITGLAFTLGALSTGLDGTVQARLAFSQLSFGADGRARIAAVVRGSASELRTAESVEIVSASDALFSFVTLPNGVSSVDTAIPVTLRVRASSAAELNGELVLNTSLGRVSTSANVAPTSNQVRVLLDGTVTGVEGAVSYRDVTVFVSSGFPGTAVLTGTYQRVGQAADRVVADIRLRAVTPAKLMLQADQTVLVPNQSTRVVAIVKDANDSPVSGAVVRFERLVDTSAGRLSSATATTNDAGIATVTYTAGTSAPLDRIEINAIVESNPAIRPQPGLLTLTVAQQAAYITVGNSDRLRASEDNIYYYHPYSMAVVDGSGRPVANQAVSVQLFASEFAKGFWRLVSVTQQNGSTVNVWQRFNYQECDTEDQNRNFTLDSGEDRNGNGRIEAANPVAIIADNDIPADANGVVTFVTDAEGKFDFDVRYPKIYSQWMRVEMKATTRVFGSELASITLQGLPVLANDVTAGDNGTRPNVNSPFGTVASCNSPD